MHVVCVFLHALVVFPRGTVLELVYQAMADDERRLGASEIEIVSTAAVVPHLKSHT